MKELSIEEKAKRYDEVVNEIKNLRDMLLEEGVIKKDGVLCDNFNRIFPELKESEDENIRKALIHFFSNTENTSFEYWEGIPKSKVISWLEKQAEHANFRNKIQIGDKVTRNEDGVLVNLSQLKRVAKKDEKQGEQKYTQRDIDDAYLKGIADVKREVEKIDEQTKKMKKEIAEFIFNSKEDIKQRYEWIKCLGFDVKFSNEDKQGEQKPTFEMKTPEESLGVDSDTYNKIVDECIYGEQKPADKVEPRFKVGDWVVRNDETLQISGIDTMLDGTFHYWFTKGTWLSSKKMEDAMLWTIQDAKAGDVLVASDGSIFLFAGTVDCACKYYVALTTDDVVKFNKGLEHYWETSTAVHPATKEQRNKLEKAITEAGYEWDAEKKELKKIKQKPAWSEEDERWFKELELMALSFSNDDSYRKRFFDWLKSLKDRVVPQTKQEWSDEDIEMINWLIRCCEKEHEELCNDRYGHQEIVSDLKRDCRKKWDWLESLKNKVVPQNRWKPSEEQINALNYVVNLMASSERPTENDLYYNILKSLRQQLKKLK